MLQSLRDAACPGAAALTGMPHTPGIKDKVGDLAAEIVDMDARVGFLEEEVKASEGQIMPFIQGIDDDQTAPDLPAALPERARMERGRSGHRRPQFGGFGKDGVLPLPR